jgi:argininosuccinate lyase
VTLLSGLPAGYHRDLQEDKEPGFDAAETVNLILPALTGCVRTFAFRPERMRTDANDADLYATDLAEALVRDGVPFREAHRRTGELMKRLAGEGRTLHDLSPEEWSDYGIPDGAARLDPDVSVRARDMPGGPAPDRVREQCDALEAAIARRRG